MSVAPDMLLKSAPEIKPRPSAAKTPERPAEPRKNEASSFAQVYAKERQAKSAERAEGAAKADRNAQPEPKGDASVVPGDAVEQPVVADSGKALPTEAESDEPVLDPLLLLGMGMAEPPAEVSTDPALQLGSEAQADPAMVANSSLLSSGPASMTDASFDPEIDALNQMPAVQMALELGAKAKAAAAEQASPTGQANQATLSAGQSFASAMAAMGSQQLDAPPEDSLDVPLLELTREGLEALKESSADTRPENFVSKLSALSQAIGQQAAQAPRTPLAPGQPIAMHQGGWSEAVVDRVMLLSSQNLKSAEIQLDPAELGRLDVRISVNQDQTQVTFASPNANVREALEGQMHRLREMFAQQGMTMDANVSDQSLNRGWQGQENDGRGRGSSGSELLAGSESDLTGHAVELKHSPLSGGRGMVDFYA
ncbi:flagellar hook-length control protein FliK [Pseudomonas borbori]